VNQEQRRSDRPLAFGAALLAAVVVTSALVLILPAGQPARVLAGLLLFIALPGIGFREAFIRPSAPLASWEGMALAGALGLTASSLACLLIVAVGVPLSEISVAASCAVLTALAVLVIATRNRPLPLRPPRRGLLALIGALGSIVLAAVVGSAAGTFEHREYYTVFALNDPAAARSAIEAVAHGSSDAIVRVSVESHEAGTESYRLQVGGDQYPEFTLRPSEALVVDARIHPQPGGPIEIRLFKGGAPYRLLRLDAP
jgi:hypothetical protein